MRRTHRPLCLLILLAGLLLLPSRLSLAAAANMGTPTVRDVAIELGDSAVHYPQLEGMADAAVQDAVNSAIVEQGKIAQRMVTQATLQAGGTGLNVTYQAYLKDGVFSAVIDAVGIMENGRAGQEYATVNFDLTTGEPLQLTDLFADMDGAVIYMEETLAATYLDELGSYVVNGELAPLPAAHFAFDGDGITFYYPGTQFSLVSGYSGAAHFYFSELLAYLKTDTQALPAMLGLLPETLTDAQTKAAIAYMAQQGQLPGIQVSLGEAMPDVIARYRLLREPDQYPGGRYCQLEAPAFRQVLVLTDALTGGFAQSTVTGILSFRTDVYGIRVGETTQARWREILGEPDNAVAFDDSLAASYGLPVGTGDYYDFETAQLLLYADAQGVLYAVRLTGA